jgi:polyisoprenoid-binding protein YceI
MNILIIFSLALLSFPSFAQKVTLDVKLSPAGSFQGVSSKAKGELVKVGDTFTADKITVSIESFRTGIDLRDEHMWKHLNSSKHPRAVLTNLKAKNGKATADLEVNGVKKPVAITYQVKGTAVEANFTVNASQFGLKKAEYLGVGVNDQVGVAASIPYKTK